MKNRNKLVAYFSASGVTAEKAEALAEAIDAPVYEIRPAKPYSEADLNWMDPRSRSSVEMKNPESRPELADHDAPVAQADVIYLGFPIWWYQAPRIIESFLQAYDFSGKTIVLFATSGGSSLGKSALELRPLLAESTKLAEGGMLNGSYSAQALKEFADRF